MLPKKRRNLLFLEAAALTMVIYLLAILTNAVLDESRLAVLDEDVRLSAINHEASEAFELYAITGDINCTAYRMRLFEQQKTTKELATDISNYAFLFTKNNEKLSDIRQREYYLSQIDLYFSVEAYNNFCEETIVPGFYFFNAESNSFDRQGVIIESFALNSKNRTMIFSFDAGFEDEALITRMKEQHNITLTPYFIYGNVSHATGQRLIGTTELRAEFERLTQ